MPKRAYLLEVKVTPTFVVLDEEGRPLDTFGVKEPWVLRFHQLGRLAELVHEGERAGTEAVNAGAKAAKPSEEEEPR